MVGNIRPTISPSGEHTMTTPNPRLQALAPYLHFTHLDSLATDDLDRHARRAEECMNQALERRRWSLAASYRNVVRESRREIDRRRAAMDSPTVNPGRPGDRR
jgi:hypothetical protein